MQDKWAADAWMEAHSRLNTSPNSLRQDEEACLIFVTCGTASLGFQVKCSSMSILSNMKMRINHEVDSSYGFDTSRAPNSISRNSSRVRALLTETTFVYRVRLIASPFATN